LVIPRIAEGEITPEKLVFGETYGLLLVIRELIFSVLEQDLPAIWDNEF
jgi:hypothetical protein